MSSQIRVAVPTPGTLEVIVDNFGDFISTFSDRLSRDGVLIPEAPDLPRGSEVSVKFRLSDGFSLVEAVGLVSEVKAGGLGVHFLVIQSGAELVDKVVGDHLSSGGQPFLVDSAAVAAAIPTVADEEVPPPAAAPVPEAPDATDDPEDSVRDLLALDGKPAFAPGMVRLDGEGAQERAALSGLGSIDTQSKPLDGLGEDSPMTQKVSIPAPEEVVFQTDGEAQSELEAAVSAMVPIEEDPPQGTDLELLDPVPGPTSIPPAAPPDEQDLAHLSEDDFASEIDSALDSAFGGEVDAALDAAFGPTDAGAGMSNLVEPSGLGDPASEELDASTRMVRIPDLTEPAVGGQASPPTEDPSALDSAASAAADLLGGEASESDDAVDALRAEGLVDLPDDGGPDGASLEFPSDAELTPIPAPELEDLGLPEPLSGGSEGGSPSEAPEVDLATLVEPGEQAADDALGDNTLAPPVDELTALGGGGGGDTPEIPEALTSVAALSSDSGDDVAPDATPSQLEMPSLEQHEANDPYGFEEPARSRLGSRSGLIPLLLLALIGVGAWQVTDLARKEFARLEPDPEVVARVTLEDEDELGSAAFDSLLSLGKQENGPVVDLSDQVSLATVTVLENVSWESLDGGTRFVFAGDGAFSPMDTRMTRLDGDSPRIVLKIGGIRSPYEPDVLPVRTEDVAQLRFGFHLLPLRNEVHAVFDLANSEAFLKEAKFAEGRLEVLISTEVPGQ